MFWTRHSSELDPKTRREFDNIAGQLQTWAEADHDDDGTNLDGVPIGARVKWTLSTAPARWLLCDGGAYSRTTYKALFRVIGVTQGVGDGSTTFNVPTESGFIIYAGV